MKIKEKPSQQIPDYRSIFSNEEISMPKFQPDDLKQWRLRHNFSQEESAKLLRLGLRTIRRLESGFRIKDETLKRLIRAMSNYDAKNKSTPDIPAPTQPSELPTASESLTPAGLKSWREKYNISRKEFHKLAGVSMNTISNFETGIYKFQTGTLAKVTKAMKEVEVSNSMRQAVSDIENRPADGKPDLQATPTDEQTPTTIMPTPTFEQTPPTSKPMPTAKQAPPIKKPTPVFVSEPRVTAAPADRLSVFKASVIGAAVVTAAFVLWRWAVKKK